MSDKAKVDSLLSARDLIRTSLEKSRAIGLELDKTGLRLDDTRRRLASASLEFADRPVHQRKCTIFAIRDHIDCAIRPAEAVLKIYGAVCELENLLLSDSQCSDLFTYISNVKKLEESLQFLKDNCTLAIQWLQGAIEFMEDNGVASNRCIYNVRKSLSILQNLQAKEERSRLSGGSLRSACDKLEGEFKQLLIENSVPFALGSSAPQEEQIGTTTSLVPALVERKLQAIIERLKANNRVESCISIYVDIRSLNARASLQAFDLDYLLSPVSDHDDAVSLDNYIGQWSEHLSFAVKHVFEHEYQLCSKILEPLGSDIFTRCFADIAWQSSLRAFLQFGKRVTESKKGPNKLLALLHVFSVLEALRVDFSRLFGKEACADIQTLTRDLIKNVVDGAWGIFWELSYQVELQRQSPPPLDGSVPGLVSFVTEYCDQLLGDTYRSALIQILTIHQSWKRKKYQEGLFTNQIYNIMKELGLNLNSWSKAYSDSILSYLFMMNNHCHLSNLKGTKLGDMMGDSWLRAHEQYKNYYAALYLKESWGKLPIPLTQDAHILFSDEGAVAKDLLGRRLKEFNEAFDEMYKKQFNWSIPDGDLREKVTRDIVRTIVPEYRNYIQKYKNVVDQDVHSCKHIKHSIKNLEDMLESLFQQKPGMQQKTYTLDNSIDKLENVVPSQFYLALTAI